MKVLHVLNGVSGGAARSVAELVRGMEPLGVSSYAVCHTPPREGRSEQGIVDEAFDHSVEYLPLYRWNRRIRSRRVLRPLMAGHQWVTTGAGWQSARRIAEIATEIEPDVIHTSTFITPEGAIAARALGLPHVWHVRELIGEGQPFRFYGGRSGFRQIADGSHFVVNSPTTRACFEQLVPDGITHLVPNGLPLDAFRSIDEQRRAGRASGGPLVVGMVANLTSTLKRHQLFIDAAARCPTEAALEFRIYGVDPSTSGRNSRTARYAEHLHQEVRDLGLADRFAFAGYRSDPAEIMGEIDILVMPNETESFGRVAVEAMAAGSCVVAVDTESLRYVLDDGQAGVLVAPDDPERLAEGIMSLVDAPERRARLAGAGPRRAADAFSVERCSAAMVGVYEAALDDRTPARALGRTWCHVVPMRALGIGPQPMAAR